MSYQLYLNLNIHLAFGVLSLSFGYNSVFFDDITKVKLKGFFITKIIVVCV